MMPLRWLHSSSTPSLFLGQLSESQSSSKVGDLPSFFFFVGARASQSARAFISPPLPLRRAKKKFSRSQD
jgi:hypothetical protein